jgi:acyl carrier protein
MNSTIREEVQRRFAQIMKIDAGALDLDARLDDAYGVTSMQAMRLLSELELELGIDVPESEYQTLLTLNDVVRVCERLARRTTVRDDQPAGHGMSHHEGS